MNNSLEKFLDDLNEYTKALQALNEKFSNFMKVNSDTLEKLEENEGEKENV